MTAANRLSGPQKAAALVLALSEEQASALLGRMQEDEVRELSTAMASLGAVPALPALQAVRRAGLPRADRHLLDGRHHRHRWGGRPRPGGEHYLGGLHTAVGSADDRRT